MIAILLFLIFSFKNKNNIFYSLTENRNKYKIIPSILEAYIRHY